MKNDFSPLTENVEVPLSKEGNLNILYEAVDVAGESRGAQRVSPAMQFLNNALQCPRGLWTLPSRR